MISLRNICPDFLRFWEAARSEGQEEQLRLWEELYESKHPEVFQVYFSPPYWGRREDLARALQKYVEDIEKIEETTKVIEGLTSEIIKKALKTFATDETGVDIDVFIFVGVYGADGFIFPVEKGRTAVFLALECLAGYEPDHMQALIAHELSHGLHLELGRRANPEAFRQAMENLEELMSWIAGNLFFEGLAVAASKRIIPGLAERTYLFYSLDQWRWCRENERRLKEMILESLNSRDQDVARRFFTICEPTEDLPYPRTGYYVGYLAIERLLERHSLMELAAIEPKEFPKLIREALGGD